MELVPIIYTALIIFAILAIGTIIISFILYKIREKNGFDEEEEKPVLNLQPDILKPESAKSVQHKPKGKKESHKSAKKQKREKPKPYPLKNNKRIKILNQIKPGEKSSKENSSIKAANKQLQPTTKTTKKYSEEDSGFFRLDTSKKKKH